MDMSTGKSDWKQATMDSSTGSKHTSQQPTSRKPSMESMNRYTKPRKDNTGNIQTELELWFNGSEN